VAAEASGARAVWGGSGTFPGFVLKRGSPVDQLRQRCCLGHPPSSKVLVLLWPGGHFGPPRPW